MAILVDTPLLIDTNVLLRAVQPSHPMHPVALRALARLFAGSDPLVIAIQNVAEFWNAATRPLSVNGLGMTIDQVRGEVKRLEGFLRSSARAPLPMRPGNLS